MKVKFMVREWVAKTLRPLRKRYEDVRDNKAAADDQQWGAIAALSALEIATDRLGESAPYFQGDLMEKVAKLREAIMEYRNQNEKIQINYTDYKLALDKLDKILKETE